MIRFKRKENAKICRFPSRSALESRRFPDGNGNHFQIRKRLHRSFGIQTQLLHEMDSPRFGAGRDIFSAMSLSNNCRDLPARPFDLP